MDRPHSTSPQLAADAPADPRFGPRSRTRTVSLIALTALLLGLAFPQPGWGLLAHVALAPMMVAAVMARSWRSVAAAGFVIAWIWHLVMLRWMNPITIGGTIALCAYLALYFPLAMLIVRRLRHAWRLPMVILVPAVWTAVELVRGNILAGGIPWFALGHTQGPYRPEHGPGLLVQTADLLGEWGVSFIVAMASGALSDLALILLRKPAPPTTARQWGSRIRRAAPSLSLWLVILAAALGYGRYRVQQVDRALADAPPVRIAVIQTNVSQSNRNDPTPEQIARDWETMIRLTVIADRQLKPDLIVWPEGAAPFAINAEARAVYRRSRSIAATMSAMLEHLQTPVLAGLSIWRQFETVALDDGEYAIPQIKYNAAALYLPLQQNEPSPGDELRMPDVFVDPVAEYHKVHRVPFGEYIPWVEDWPWLKAMFTKYLSPYDFDYTIQAGDAFTVFEIARRSADAATNTETATNTDTTTEPARIVAPICFEDAVGRVARRMVFAPGAARRADVLVNMTNDGWYVGSDQPDQHLQMAAFRCIELRTPMARSVNAGVGGFIDAVGRIGPMVTIDGQAKPGEGAAAHDLRPTNITTLYARVGQTPLVLLACLVALAYAIALIQPRLARRATSAATATAAAADPPASTTPDARKETK